MFFVLAVAGGGGILSAVLREHEVSAVPVVTPLFFEQYEADLRNYIASYMDKVRLAPNDASVHAQLGVVYEANGLFTEARDCFANALRLDPTMTLARYHLAVTTQNLGETEEALSLYREMVQDRPDFAPALYRLGEVLLNSGNTEEAESVFRRVLFLRSDALAAHAGVATAMIRKGDYAGAARILDPIVEKYSNVRKLHYLLAQAYQGLGNKDDAKREFQLGANAEALYVADPWSETFPDHLQTYLLSDRVREAQAYFEAGKVQRAIEILELTYEKHPNNVAVLANLGTAYMMAKNPNKALGFFMRASEIDDGQFVIHANLARCYIELGQMTPALEAIDRSIRIAPDVARSQHTRGRVLAQLGRFSEALPAFERATQLESAKADYHFDYGTILQAAKRPEDAATQYRMVLALDSTSWQAHVELGRLAADRGDLDGAARHVEAARAIAPQQPRVVQASQQLEELVQR